MVSSNNIQSRQNQEMLLKIQYAARVYYNAAERLNFYTWLLCLVSAFSVFLPISCPTFVSYGVPFIADMVTLCLILLVNRDVKIAAQLRKYFDAYVLDIFPNQFSETELREIKETAGKIYSRNPQRAAIQMANTGQDSPPGVREWYVFSKPCTDVAAQFECQRQNTWWNSKMFYRRLAVTICVAVLIMLAFLLLTISNNAVTAFLCFAGLIFKIAERLIENGKYIRVSTQIDGAQQAVEMHPTKESIEKLQSFIDARRSLVVLELNWLHKKFANALSKSYDDSLS